MKLTPIDPACEHCGKPRSLHIRVGGADPALLYCTDRLSGTFRRRVPDMPGMGIQPHPGVPIGEYEHFKGGRYRVVGGTFRADAEDDEVCVQYVSLEHGYTSHRRVWNFLEMVEHGGVIVPRFRPVTGPRGRVAEAEAEAEAGTTAARTFFLIKPDAFARSKVGAILTLIEQEGFTLERLALRNPTKRLLREHYREHAAWPGLEEMVSWMVSGPLIAGVARLAARVVEDPIKALRDLVGPFRDPRPPGTIRGLLMRDDDPAYKNLIHAADSPESAARESALWFPAATPERSEG